MANAEDDSNEVLEQLLREEQANEQKFFRNPYKVYKEKQKKKRLEEERIYQLREDIMKQDFERFLMEMEEQRVWVTYQLPYLNNKRMKKVEQIAKLKRKEKEKEIIESNDSLLEDGINYFKGDVINYRKWQNSAAKHLDIKGHDGPVFSCKFSKCLRFILSASDDKTCKLWKLETGECIKTLVGHMKGVTDCDFHPSFAVHSTKICLLTCSSDSTLKLWNSTVSQSESLYTVRGHTQAIYRCSFSPDGNNFASCSEDKTIRLWCFPEGYLLFIFRGHHSPVVSVNFSPSGRYLISGSDYGERKILLWDAKLNKLMENPKQFPHMIFWTRDGLIKKILIMQTIPKPSFWLSRKQMGLIKDDSMLDIWPGEFDEDEEMPSESEDEEEDEDEFAFKETVDTSGDKKSLNDVTVVAYDINNSGEPFQVFEYKPGGNIIITIQSQSKPLSDAYIEVLSKNDRFDMFKDSTGLRLGMFDLEAPILWKPEQLAVSKLGTVLQNKRNIPTGLLQSANFQAVTYNESIRLETEDKDTIKFTEFDVLWKCPSPDLGAAIINVNFKIRGVQQWKTLTYTLSESVIRVEEKKPENETAVETVVAAEGFNFDMEDRHRKFWDYIREKKWDSVASYLEKKCIFFNGSFKHRRQWRAMNELVNIFESTDWITLHTPFVHKAGLSRSVALCDTDFDFDEYHYGDDEEEEEQEEKDDKEVDGRIDNVSDEQVKEVVDSDERSVKINEMSSDNTIQNQENNSFLISSSGEEKSNELNSTKVITESKSEKGDISDEEAIPEIGTIYEEEGENELEVEDVENDDNSEDKINQELESNNKVNEENPQNEAIESLAIESSVTPIEEVSDEKVAEEKPLEVAVVVVDVKSTTVDKDEIEKEDDEDDDDDDVEEIEEKSSVSSDHLSNVRVKIRPKAKDLQLNKAVFVIDVEGKIFQKMVHKAIKHETNLIMNMRKDNIAVIKEVRHFTVRNLLNFMQLLRVQNNCPSWLKKDYYKDLIKKLNENNDSKDNTEVTKRTIEDDSLSFTSVRRLEHKFINSGIFGPEISEFTMPLPVNYPQQAGMAMFTLRHQLEEFENQIAKLKLRKMPSTLEDVYEPSVQDRLNSLYHSIRQTKQKLERLEVKQSISDEVRLAVLSNHTYSSGRRESFVSLPGLQPHYPNPYCEPQALISTFPQSNSKRNAVDNKRSLLVEMKVFPPAGRKPNKRQLTEYGKFGFLRERDSMKKKKNFPSEVYLGRRGSNPVATGLREFSNSLLRDVEVEEQEENGSVDKALVHSLTKDTTMTSKTGLIRRFRLNGLELAHHGSVNDVIFSPSESRVVTAGGDKFIKIWDPRDGSYVRKLKGHSNEVLAVRYSNSEQFLVSSGADAEIIIWSMLSLSVLRRLLGHSDVVYSLSMSPDCSVICSSSHDQIIKTWYTTPRHPDPPEPPRVIGVTDTTAHVKWLSPPSFNLDINAFHLQYRIGTKESWFPEDGISIAPHFRSLIVRDIIGATPYQFRIRAENRMGISEWSKPSKISKTEYGIPVQFERPTICGISETTMSLLWFAPNPATFGAAPLTYEIQCKGNGKTYEEQPTLSISIEEGMERGRNIIKALHTIYNRYLATKDILVRSNARKIAETFVLDDDLPNLEAFFSIDKIKELLESVETKERTHVLVSGQYISLRPGYMYLLRTRGINVAGAGPWSNETFSNFTLPTFPSKPDPPTIHHCGLRSIEFIWNEPDSGGSAITGYKIYLQNIDKEIILPRGSHLYLWDNLFPGKSYRIKVKASNVIGWSEYSDLNDINNSHTIIGVPDVSNNPLAVSATWNSISFDVTIPFNNGSIITGVEVNYRFIDPFEVGEWTRVIRTIDNIIDGSGVYRIPKDIILIEFVDLIKQQDEMEQVVRDLEIAKSSSGFNPYAKDKNKINAEIENILSRQKPNGSKIRFVIDNLNPDTMYECRVRFINEAGEGEFSLPSHRAKTNRAALPGVCIIPTIIDIGVNFVLLEVTFSTIGGSPITNILVETMNLDESSTKLDKFYINNLDKSITHQCKIQNLLPGGSYIFRCKAQSLVGDSPFFSDFTAEINTIGIEGEVNNNKKPKAITNNTQFNETKTTDNEQQEQQPVSNEVNIKIPPVSKYQS